MYLIKHNGYFVIQHNNGKYITFSEDGKAKYSKRLSDAYKWTRKKKADNYLSSNTLLSKEDCNVRFIDSDKQRINKHLLNKVETDLQKELHFLSVDEWVSSLSAITNEFSEIDTPLSQTSNKLKETEKILSDLRHYIEFGEFNIFQGFRLLRLYQNLLRQRRSYKDIVIVLENISKISQDNNYIYWCAIQLKCRGYKPRILKNMFNNYV